MDYDLHAEAFSIADLLADQGHSQRATDIRDAIAGGSTGTEILMGLRWHLASLEKELKVAPESRARIKALVRRINSALV